VTIYRTLLAKGYFPKELPPAFFTEEFAIYATTKTGRATLENYQNHLPDKFTESTKYNLARPGLQVRELRVLHPFSFARLAGLVAKNFSRLLKKSARSKFSKSRPVYSPTGFRGIEPAVRIENLVRERAAARAGARFVLKADVSRFYPTLYTHAVGWAIDPKLRLKNNWGRNIFLGTKIDQALMNSERKISQGVPIGNDVSFLLAEGVLAQVDSQLKHPAARSYRWFDDYELSFDTYEEAENGLQRLKQELARFHLDLNLGKTGIISLPQPVDENWREDILDAAKGSFSKPNRMVRFFDTAFRLREKFPESPVLMYALGALFKVPKLTDQVSRIAQSCITQAVLCEPGAAQKAFALLSFWLLNGVLLDKGLLKATVGQMVLRHRSRGPTSDLAWGLAFCLQENIALDRSAAGVLSQFDDDCIALQALDMRSRNLLPSTFTDSRIIKRLKNEDLNGDHWLLAYETVRHNFLTVCLAHVTGNPLFADLLAKSVTFYRRSLPRYAVLLHPGGAPEWSVVAWLKSLLRREETEKATRAVPLLELVMRDLARIGELPSENVKDTILRLVGRLEDEAFPKPPADEMYTA
jgi:Reverse transcriptase (RNA-dependent DNA polymerase)